MEYSVYIELRNKAWNEGWHHWQRIAKSRTHVKPANVEHCVVFNDPYDLDAPVRVLHPDRRSVAELMAGGIHPPIEAIHAQRLRLVGSDGEVAECSRLEAPAVRWRMNNKVTILQDEETGAVTKHTTVSETVIDNSAAHLTVAMPMTYEQAIEWIIQKDIPFDVWGRQHNRPQFAIINKAALPKTREHRNSWRLSNLTKEAA